MPHVIRLWQLSPPHQTSSASPTPSSFPILHPEGCFEEKPRHCFKESLFLSEKYCYEEEKQKAWLNNAIAEKIQTPLH